MLKRRAFLFGCVSAALAAPRAAGAQPLRGVVRLGWLSPSSGPRPAFRDALRDLGWVDGTTIVFETRVDDRLERLPDRAAELVRSRVDIIVAVAPAAIRAAGQATATIPIVMAYWGGPDLVASGVVASFARPGGNITGVHMLNTALEPKRLEILLEAVPAARRIGVLTHDGARFEPQLVAVRRLADATGVQLHVADVARTHDGYDRAFEALARADVQALLVPSSPRFVRERTQIIDRAARLRMPAMYECGFMVHDGGLMAYGATQAEMDQRAAAFVDRILKGARPGELPVEQPTRFELVISLRAARALDLAIPPSLRLRADQVIE